MNDSYVLYTVYYNTITLLLLQLRYIIYHLSLTTTTTTTATTTILMLLLLLLQLQLLLLQLLQLYYSFYTTTTTTTHSIPCGLPPLSRLHHMIMHLCPQHFPPQQHLVPHLSSVQSTQMWSPLCPPLFYALSSLSLSLPPPPPFPPLLFSDCKERKH